jgi:hypothetical protein
MPIVPIPLSDLVQGAPLGEAFDALHQPDWFGHGIYRWRDLVRPDGSWPIVVLGDLPEPGRLLGTIVGTWAPAPIARFDDLLETACDGGWRAPGRPSGGSWHFFALTVAESARGAGLQQQLVAAALDWVVRHTPGAGVRTLSPAQGLPGLVGLVPARFAPSPDERAEAAIVGLCDARGRSALPILRLHPVNGADLEAVLHRSRRDEARSGQVTLRFSYALNEGDRARQRSRHDAFVAARAAAIAAGRGVGPLLHEGRELWFVSPALLDGPPVWTAARRGASGLG